MFEFAISRNQRRRPTRRIYASWVVSCLFHLCLLGLLIQYPQLLRGGMYHHFRPLSVITNLFGSKTQDEDNNWRTVAVLRGPMMAPSATTLKKYLKDWNDKGSGSPPIRIRWGDEQKSALRNLPPMPRVREEPKPQVVLPPPNEMASAGGTAGNSSENASGASTTVQADPSGGKRGTVNLPPPGPAPKTEVASNNAPSSIPNGVKPPSNITKPPDSVKVFQDEHKAISSPESGFFDTGGFAIGEYAKIIKERIKGKWFIPSNLRNSQGHTTVVFYIGKDGRFTDARIVTSSGSNSLDLAALKAVIDSNPFPPLPKGFPGDHLGAKFVLSYNEP